MRWESFKFWYLVRLILETLRYEWYTCLWPQKTISCFWCISCKLLWSDRPCDPGQSGPHLSVWIQPHSCYYLTLSVMCPSCPLMTIMKCQAGLVRALTCKTAGTRAKYTRVQSPSITWSVLLKNARNRSKTAQLHRAYKGYLGPSSWRLKIS